MLLTFRAANGAMSELLIDGEWNCSEWFSDISIIQSLTGQSPDDVNTRQLAIATRGNADVVLTEMFNASVYQQLEYQGGEFLIASSATEGVQGMALWRGPYHEISTYLPYSVSLNPTAALSVLEGLDFDDAPEGLLVTPQPGLGETVVVRSSSIHVDGVGLVELIPGSEALPLIPVWEGVVVIAGELWQLVTTLVGQTIPQFLLATPTAALIVSPGEFGTQPALDFIESILQATVNELTGS